MYTADHAALPPARSLVVACCLLLCACGKTGQWSGPPPSPDFALFQSDVYPVLLRDCAFSECHGSEKRFFQVFGPGRMRLDPATTMPGDPVTPMELQRSYERSVSMLMSAETVTKSLFLRKPLEASQGGQGHKGVDAFGRNVFASPLDPSYAILLHWALSRGAGPGATVATNGTGGMP